MVLSELLPKHQITFSLIWVWWDKDLAKDPLKGMSMEMGDSRGIWRIKCIRLWMNQSCYSQGVYLSKFSLETLHFMGIRVFIVGYVKECEKSFFCKTRGFGEWLTTKMSHEFQSPNNRMAKLNFLSCSDPAIMALQLPECSTHVTFLASHH